MTDEELEAEGLYDPTTDGPRRAELLRRCLAMGLTVDELRDAGPDLMQRAIDAAYRSGRQQLTLAEAAQRAGVDDDLLQLIARAAGFASLAADERVWTDEDAESMTVLGGAVDLLGEDAIAQILRVTNASVGRIGDAVISSFLTSAGAKATAEDESGLSLLEANIAGAALLEHFGPFIARSLIRYMRLAYRQSSEAELATAYAEGVDTPTMTIGFADLVGSTSHAERRTLVELNSVLERFEATVVDVVAEHGGRIVKFIGDEVMFRADEPVTAAGIAIELADAVKADPGLPPLRAGLAHGMVLGRGGDYFGPTVNMAARVLKLAPMNGVVAPLATAELIGTESGIAIDPLGAIEMPGLDEPVDLTTLRRR